MLFLLQSQSLSCCLRWPLMGDLGSTHRFYSQILAVSSACSLYMNMVEEYDLPGFGMIQYVSWVMQANFVTICFNWKVVKLIVSVGVLKAIKMAFCDSLRFNSLWYCIMFCIPLWPLGHIYITACFVRWYQWLNARLGISIRKTLVILQSCSKPGALL